MKPGKGRKLVQEARELKALLERSSLSLRAIAKRRRVSPAALSQLLAITRLPEEILAEVERRPELASKTKLAMLSRCEGEEREQLWARIQAGESSDKLRNRKRGSPLEVLSPRSRDMLDAIGRSMRRELAGELPPGGVTSERMLDFSVEILASLWASRRDGVLDSYLDFVEREEAG